MWGGGVPKRPNKRFPMKGNFKYTWGKYTINIKEGYRRTGSVHFNRKFVHVCQPNPDQFCLLLSRARVQPLLFC